MVATPPGNASVVPGQENIRDFTAFPDSRPRKVRIFEEIVFEAFLAQRCLGADDAGQEADASVDQGHGCDFAAREHIVADGDFLELARVDDALVKLNRKPWDSRDTSHEEYSGIESRR